MIHTLQIDGEVITIDTTRDEIEVLSRGFILTTISIKKGEDVRYLTLPSTQWNKVKELLPLYR